MYHPFCSERCDISISIGFPEGAQPRSRFSPFYVPLKDALNEPLAKLSSDCASLALYMASKKARLIPGVDNIAESRLDEFWSGIHAKHFGGLDSSDASLSDTKLPAMVNPAALALCRSALITSPCSCRMALLKHRTRIEPSLAKALATVGNYKLKVFLCIASS